VPELTLRPAAPAEFEAVGELCVAAYAPFLEPGGHYAAVLRDAGRRAADAELVVAADGGALLGTVTFVPDGGPLGEIATARETEFRVLAVSAAAQGRGVGAALVGWVLQQSRARGKGVVCSTLPAMHAAHRLYERHGFRRAPERDWSPVAGVDLLVFTAPAG
jgi:GNAT superfamily N-acetyltransferase